VLATSLSKSIDQRYDISRLITKKELLCLRQLNKRRPNPFDFSKDMVAKPARDQKTPSQSHSSGSYWETDMCVAERLHSNGWEPFDYLKVFSFKNPLEFMNKKNLIIGGGILSFLIIVILGFNYWQAGTPGYSFKQLQSAYNNNDTEKFKKYYDVDQVFDNFYKRVLAIAVNQIQNSSESSFEKQIEIAQANNTATSGKQSFEKQIYDAVSGKTKVSADTNEFKGFLSIFLNSKPTFKVSSNVATADILFDNYVFKNQNNYPIYKFKVILKQTDDRSWIIIDIQGYEDYTYGSLGDVSRLKDISTIIVLINKYINAGEKPILTNDNWRTVLKDYSNKIGGEAFLPEDPMSSYSDSNKYSFSIINADSLKTYSYIMKAKLSTIDNSSFKGTDYKNLSYVEIYNKLSNGNISNVLGLDCSVPAYCVASWGNDSEWAKLLK